MKRQVPATSQYFILSHASDEFLIAQVSRPPIVLWVHSLFYLCIIGDRGEISAHPSLFNYWEWLGGSLSHTQ